MMYYSHGVNINASCSIISEARSQLAMLTNIFFSIYPPFRYTHQSAGPQYGRNFYHDDVSFYASELFTWLTG